MTAPNLLSAENITGKTVGAVLPNTNTTDVLVNSASLDKVFKVNSVYAANVGAAGAKNITLSFYDASATASYKLAFSMEIPLNSCLVLIEKLAPIYLEEGDKLTAQASSANSVELIISYEEISG